MTFKGLLNKKNTIKLLNQHRKKETRRELSQSTETTKLALISEPIYEYRFLKYATTLYNPAPKQIQEVENCCDVVPRLKNFYLKKH